MAFYGVRLMNKSVHLDCTYIIFTLKIPRASCCEGVTSPVTSSFDVHTHHSSHTRKVTRPLPNRELDKE